MRTLIRGSVDVNGTEMSGGRGGDVVLGISAGAMEPSLHGLAMVRTDRTMVVGGLNKYKMLDGLVKLSFQSLTCRE